MNILQTLKFYIIDKFVNLKINDEKLIFYV